MIAKCVRTKVSNDDVDCPVRYLDLTVRRVYTVLAIEADDYRLVGDDHRPYLYPSEAFELVDPVPGTDWVREECEDGEEVYWGPPELAEPGLFEDYFDGVDDAIVRVEDYIAHLGSPESNA